MREFFRTFYMAIISAMFLASLVIHMYQMQKLEEQNIEIYEITQTVDSAMKLGELRIKDLENRYDGETTMDDILRAGQNLIYMQEQTERINRYW